MEYTRFFLPLSLVTSWLFIAVFRRHAPQIHGRTFISLLLLVVAIGLSAGNAANPGLSVWWFLLLSSYSLAAVLAIFYARNVPQARRTILVTVTVLAVAQVVLGLLQLSTGHTFGLSLLGEPSASDATPGIAKILLSGVRLIRPLGTYPHANLFGAIAVVGLAAASFATTSASYASRLTYRLTVGLLTIGVVLSFSRSAWLALLMLCIVTFFLAGRKRWMFTSSVVVALSALAIVWLPLISSRFLIGEQVNQIALRNTLATESINVWLSNPWVGVGLRNFVVDLSVRHPDWLGFELQPPHNVLLLMLAEIGIVGLAALAAVLVPLFRRWPLIALGVLAVLAPLLFLDHYAISITQGTGIVLLFVQIMALYSVPRKTNSSRTT